MNKLDFLYWVNAILRASGSIHCRVGMHLIHCTFWTTSGCKFELNTALCVTNFGQIRQERHRKIINSKSLQTSPQFSFNIINQLSTVAYQNISNTFQTQNILSLLDIVVSLPSVRLQIVQNWGSNTSELSKLHDSFATMNALNTNCHSNSTLLVTARNN